MRRWRRSERGNHLVRVSVAFYGLAGVFIMVIVVLGLGKVGVELVSWE
jgi:hypothetical protein